MSGPKPPQFGTFNYPNPPSISQNPPNSNYYQNGVLQSSQNYDSGSNTYNTNSYATPQQQQIQNQATGFISDMIPKVNDTFNAANSPEQMEAYKQAYMTPQVNALNTSYDKALGSAVNGANANGMLNSAGFEKFRQNEVEKNRAQGLADINANAEVQKYQLPSMALQPYSNLYNFYNAAVGGQQAQTQQSLDPTMQSGQLGAQLYGNASGRYMPQAYQLPQQRGFFSRLFGG